MFHLFICFLFACFSSTSGPGIRRGLWPQACRSGTPTSKPQSPQPGKGFTPPLPLPTGRARMVLAGLSRSLPQPFLDPSWSNLAPPWPIWGCPGAPGTPNDPLWEFLFLPSAPITAKVRQPLLVKGEGVYSRLVASVKLSS